MNEFRTRRGGMFTTSDRALFRTASLSSKDGTSFHITPFRSPLLVASDVVVLPSVCESFHVQVMLGSQLIPIGSVLARFRHSELSFWRTMRWLPVPLV